MTTGRAGLSWKQDAPGNYTSANYRVRPLHNAEGRGRSTDRYASEVHDGFVWQRLSLHATVRDAKAACDGFARSLAAQDEPAQPEPRVYLVGLPVLVTVHDDGTVTFAVCKEDASEAIADEGAPLTDVATVDAWLKNGAHS